MKTMKKIVAIMAAVLMLCSILPLSVMAADTYELASSIAVGDTVVLVCNSKSMELSGMNGTSYGLGTAYSGTPAGTYALTVEEGSSAGTYAFKTVDGTYLAWSSGNSLKTISTINASSSWTVTFNSTTATIANVGTSARKLQWNASSPRFACYTSSQTAVNLYKKVTSTPPTTCEHTWVDANCTTPKTCSACSATDGAALGHNYVEDIIDATCTQTGTATYECSVCFDSYDEEIPTIPHNYVDGACSVCGAEEPNVVDVTISFATADQRVSQNGDQQVWQNGAVTLTNNKAASTNAIVSNVNPVRLYANSEIIVDCINMTKIVFNCNNTTYATALKNSISNTATATATVNSKVVTVEFTEPQNSFTIEKLTAQVRLDSLVVTAAAGGSEPDCEHANALACDTHCPDCSALINAEAAHKNNAQYPCQDGACEYCGEAVAAVDHNYDENDVCTVCGLAPTPEKAVDPENPQKYVFSEFAAGTQYAENEKHYLDNAVTVITNKAHFTSELRIYSSTTYDATAIIKSTKDISAIVLNAGNKVDVLNLYVSADGEVYEAIEVTSSGYNDYTVLIPEMTKYIKLDVAGDQQIRIKEMTLYFDGEVPHTCEYTAEETQAPTCTEPGVMTYTCTCGASYTEEIPAGHTYDDNCDTDCNVCEEYRFDAPHNLTTKVEAVEPANCQEEGNPEYWICADCNACFQDNGWGGYSEVNPAWLYYTGEHVRPEGAIVCAVVACELCGEDTYGEACDRGDAPVCQDAPCVNCGETVWGWGCNYNTGDEEVPAPLCQPGDCVYCGTHYEKLYDCENGSWAPCQDGECSYGCGKQYPATANHTLEDCTVDGNCSVCWSYIPAGEHTYAHEYDADCDVCGAVRAVVAPVADSGFSVSEDVSGLAVRFNATLEGMGIDGTTAIYDNATLNGYKVISMGAIVTNGVSTIDVPAVYLCDDDVSTGAQYAIRIKNIPADKYDVEITFTPYMIVEIDGEQVTINGEAVTGTYNQYAG